MRKDLTELVFILDRSGSMYGLEQDTIGGFNAMLEKQKAEAGTCVVTTILFNHEIRIVHDRVDIQQIPALTDKEYTVCGNTALLDAIGYAMKHIQTIHRYIREEDRPEHTLFVITTDGMENASRNYDADGVRAMVRRQQETCGWEFLFMGANIDAVSTAKSIGIDASHAATYINDPIGVATNYEAVSEAICAYRSRKGVKPSWKDRIQRDYSGRNV